MREVCNLFRPTLELYAEGELVEARVARRLQRHLDRCSACRRFLADYDALTVRMLEASVDASARDLYVFDREPGDFDPRAIQSRWRVDRIVERIETLREPRRAHGSAPRYLHRYLHGSGVAAAVLFVAWLLNLTFLPNTTVDEDEADVAAVYTSGYTSGTGVEAVAAAEADDGRPGVLSLNDPWQMRWLHESDADLDGYPHGYSDRGGRGSRVWFYAAEEGDDTVAGRIGERVFRLALEVKVTEDRSTCAESLVLVREDVLLGRVDGVGRRPRPSAQRAGPDSVVFWGVPRQLVKLPPTRSVPWTGRGAGPPRQYRVVSVANPSLLPAVPLPSPTARFPSATAPPFEWGVGGGRLSLDSGPWSVDLLRTISGADS